MTREVPAVRHCGSARFEQWMIGNALQLAVNGIHPRTLREAGRVGAAESRQAARALANAWPDAPTPSLEGAPA